MTINILAKAVKFVPILIAVVILIMQCWSIFLNKQVFRNGDISIHLSSVQESSHALLADLILLRDYLTDENQIAVDQYIQQKMPMHKQWLKEIIYGQKEQHPLVIFSEKYLRLLKGLRNRQLVDAFTTRLDLFELVDNITQQDNNILTLSKQRTIDNHQQLKRSIMLAELVTVIVIILLLFYFLSIRLENQRRKKDNYKAKKLSLFFSDYPIALVRLSSRGNVRYYNKQASAMMKKYKIKKSKLLPANIKKKLDKAIELPNKTIRVSHSINNVPIYCDIRLCPDSGQIYMMVSEVSAESPLSQTNDEQSLAANT